MPCSVGGGFTLLGEAHWQVHPNIRLFAQHHNTPRLAYNRLRDTDVQNRSTTSSQLWVTIDSTVQIGMRVALVDA